MFRYLALCLVVALVYVDPASSQLEQYALKTRALKQASDLLLNNLNELRNYRTLGDLSVQYFLLVQVGYSTALRATLFCAPPLEKLYLLALDEDLGRALSDPLKEALQVDADRRKTLNYLQPLLDLVNKLCFNTGDNECDRLVNAALEQDRELLKTTRRYLDPAYKVASGLLAKDRRLREVAATKDVVPYLLQNQDDALRYVNDVTVLLRLLGRLPSKSDNKC